MISGTSSTPVHPQDLLGRTLMAHLPVLGTVRRGQGKESRGNPVLGSQSLGKLLLGVPWGTVSRKLHQEKLSLSCRAGTSDFWSGMEGAQKLSLFPEVKSSTSREINNSP